MSKPTIDLSPAEWEALIKRYLASGQSQSAFCRLERVSRFAFSYRYQRSPQFAGRRRKVRDADSESTTTGGAFRPLKARPATPVSTDGVITIHIGNVARIECAGEVALTVISRLAREAAQ